MKNFKHLFVILIVSSFLMAASCVNNTPNADQIQAKQTSQALLEANNQIGMPAITNFQQKKDLKEILELLDKEDMITHTYLAGSLHGRVGEYLGQSVGYGIPAATQYTNPMKIVDMYPSSTARHMGTLPQADPNGLFMPTATSATWIKLIDPEGVPRVVFIEPLIIVSPFKLH